MLTATLFTIAKTQKQPKGPLTAEWIQKMWCIHTMVYQSTIKKEWNNTIYSNMDTIRNYYTKWTKPERQISYDITYMWNLKYDTNEPIYETETNSQT